MNAGGDAYVIPAAFFSDAPPVKTRDMRFFTLILDEMLHLWYDDNRERTRYTNMISGLSGEIL